MLSFEEEVSLYEKEIFFIKKFINYVTQFYFGLSLRLPIILVGETGQGKQTSIHYMAKN